MANAGTDCHNWSDSINGPDPTSAKYDLLTPPSDLKNFSIKISRLTGIPSIVESVKKVEKLTNNLTLKKKNLLGFQFEELDGRLGEVIKEEGC